MSADECMRVRPAMPAGEQFAHGSEVPLCRKLRSFPQVWSMATRARCKAERARICVAVLARGAWVMDKSGHASTTLLALRAGRANSFRPSFTVRV